MIIFLHCYHIKKQFATLGLILIVLLLAVKAGHHHPISNYHNSEQHEFAGISHLIQDCSICDFQIARNACLPTVAELTVSEREISIVRPEIVEKVYNERQILFSERGPPNLL
ncbi:MAG TPA: hypothetical protein PKI85_03230 [Chitinophagaceae bacterium]|nr:hypothetical protein [Chitinophagaceae bacterium]